MTPTWICAAGDYCEAVVDEPPKLKPLVREVLGEPVRRIDRFIELALIGAGRCVGGRALPSGTGVYTGSARGDLQVTLDVVEPLFRSGQTPKPLSFVNTVSNATNFYIARQFGLTGCSNFVSHRELAFESALELAVVDMEAGHLASALVGSVDVATAPLAEHRMRLGLPRETTVAEASHWIWLRRGDRPGGALAELIAARRFSGTGDLAAWLDARELPANTRLVVAEGCGNAGLLADLENHAGLAPTAPSSAPGHYGSRSGAVLGDFLRRGEDAGVLHVNRGADGDLAIMLARRP